MSFFSFTTNSAGSAKLWSVSLPERGLEMYSPSFLVSDTVSPVDRVAETSGNVVAGCIYLNNCSNFYYFSSRVFYTGDRHEKSSSIELL